MAARVGSSSWRRQLVLKTCDGGSRVETTGPCNDDAKRHSAVTSDSGESSPRRLVTTAARGGCLWRWLVFSSRRRHAMKAYGVESSCSEFVTVAGEGCSCTGDGGSRRWVLAMIRTRASKTRAAGGRSSWRLKLEVTTCVRVDKDNCSLLQIKVRSYFHKTLTINKFFWHYNSYT